MKESAILSGSLGRRRVIQGLFSMLFAGAFAPAARGQKADASLPVVRISRGAFAPEKYETVKARLDASQKTLVPAIRQLSGCLHYFAAIDRDSSSMVNVSVWRSLADAQQMQTLGPMLALAEEFAREGVRFERPIINYQTLWAVSREMVTGSTRLLRGGLAALAVVVALAAAIPHGAAAEPSIDQAKQLFDRYVSLEHAFDPAAADLYADDALIRNKRIYPDGTIRELTLPAPQYKKLIRSSMPLAKARNDTSSYSDVKYANADGRVRITATRFSNRKKYSSPISLLVGPGPGGTWLIHEELSESRP
jgi:hypothetical protein